MCFLLFLSLSRVEKLAKRLDRTLRMGHYDDNDVEAASRLDLPENFRMAFVDEFTGQSSIRMEEFKTLIEHEDPLEIEAGKAAEAKPRKKKHLNVESFNGSSGELREAKFKKRPLKADEQFDDGTYRFGRTVYDKDGEVLYRIG